MYERSAIVLERYLDKLFGLNKENNLRQNFLDFNNLVKELKEYQTMVTEEEKVINKFDGIAHEIQSIQKSQENVENLEKAGYSVFHRNPSDTKYQIKNSTEFYCTSNTIYILYAYGNDNYTSEIDVVVI